MKYKSCTEYWIDPETGDFRGEYEKMYQEIDDPWGCNKEAKSLKNCLLLEIIFNKKRYRRILDVGCGLGAITNLIYKKNGGGELLGCDISETAIKKASLLYPRITFKQMNIITESLEEIGKFELIILSEILWYILEGLETVFNKIIRVLAQDGTCVMLQYFPEVQKFGREYIDGSNGLESFITQRTSFCISEKVTYHVDDGTHLILALQRR